MSRDRYDLAVKHRFFRHLMAGCDPDSERLYRWHIEKRTGGVERRSWKRSVDDYVRACRQLLAAMNFGYDAKHPVLLGSNGRLMDGAHRIACAIALDTHVATTRVEKPGKAAPWGRDWFAVRGISTADLARIEADWTGIAA